MVLAHVAEVLEGLTYVDEAPATAPSSCASRRRSATASSRASTTSTLDEEGRVADLTVFMRPMSALTAFNARMAERLGVELPLSRRATRAPAFRIAGSHLRGSVRVVKGDWL